MTLLELAEYDAVLEHIASTDLVQWVSRDLRLSQHVDQGYREDWIHLRDIIKFKIQAVRRVVMCLGDIRSILTQPELECVLGRS